jgi:hypothetical protein
MLALLDALLEALSAVGAILKALSAEITVPDGKMQC